eukprot:CAMPEP_0194567818 /NCGR_PEP_ID=MMETSP0292-20121207/6140_1 /TAXON_ID=39354 /ORGANISM="Heterosigma akashiwo, Strain CCMP2393" /LENGTH=143 /DNA_ID=CAMNT_0039417661 /DNA_START=44 /DNA_END=477 /DNA_ORIENTATION=-
MKTKQDGRIMRPLLGLEALEVSDLDVLHQGVEGLLRVFVLVALAAQANAHAVGDVLDALGPDELVELGIDSHVACAHHLSGEGLDLADGLGGLLPEGGLVQPLVKVDGVVGDTTSALRVFLSSVGDVLDALFWGAIGWPYGMK